MCHEISNSESMNFFFLFIVSYWTLNAYTILYKCFVAKYTSNKDTELSIGHEDASVN